MEYYSTVLDQAFVEICSKNSVSWQKLEIKFSLDMTTMSEDKRDCFLNSRTRLIDTDDDIYMLDLGAVMADCSIHSYGNLYMAEFHKRAIENMRRWVLGDNPQADTTSVSKINNCNIGSLLTRWWGDAVLKTNFELDINVKRNSFEIAYPIFDNPLVYPFVLFCDFPFTKGVDWMYVSEFSEFIRRLNQSLTDPNRIVDFQLTVLNANPYPNREDPKVTEGRGFIATPETWSGIGENEKPAVSPDTITQPEFYTVVHMDASSLDSTTPLGRKAIQVIAILSDYRVTTRCAFSITALMKYEAFPFDMATIQEVLDYLCDAGMLLRGYTVGQMD